MGQRPDPGLFFFLHPPLPHVQFPPGRRQIINGSGKLGKFIVSLQRDFRRSCLPVFSFCLFLLPQPFHAPDDPDQIGEPLPQHKEEKYHKYRQGAKGADAAPPYSQHPLLHPGKFHAPVDKVVFRQCAGQIIEKAKYKAGDQHADQQIFQDLYRQFFPFDLFTPHSIPFPRPS